MNLSAKIFIMAFLLASGGAALHSLFGDKEVQASEAVSKAPQAMLVQATAVKFEDVQIWNSF